VVLAFEGWKKSNVLFGAVGKAKTTCAVGERWEGRDWALSDWVKIIYGIL
jgi:hypothetical protein